MHHFARRTAGIVAALAVVTAFAAGCDKDDKNDSASATSTTVTTTVAATEHGEHTGATETKIATRDGGEIAVSGDVLAKYTAAGGATGPLGEPIGAQQEAAGGGVLQEFAGGAIYVAPGGPAHVVWGEIRKAYDENGGPGGKLGYPTSDETDIAGGKQSTFTGGTITWVDNKTTVTTN
ncbi:LGFP repeat-containing protein [Nocardia inohanensis]|uniref:LGFP repeat-containing protein n=1 Tax=Nocardia inohanensis TaxID=209246 RepID=UPI000831B942|nr:esterase [Nocardia inohanensis]